MKICLPIFLLFISFNSHAALVKWVDANGKVHYSDGPPPVDVKSETVHTFSAPDAPSSAPPARKTIFEQEADLKKAQKAKDEAAQKASKQEEEARVKQKNCELARNQLLTLQNAPRIATYNANGERTFMDDATRQKSTDEAQAAVSQYCN